jgi:hypothetical protein
MLPWKHPLIVTLFPFLVDQKMFRKKAAMFRLMERQQFVGSVFLVYEAPYYF